MAERGGFEPPVPLLGVHTISSRAPSTARPPLLYVISTTWRVGLVIWKVNVSKMCPRSVCSDSKDEKLLFSMDLLEKVPRRNTNCQGKETRRPVTRLRLLYSKKIFHLLAYLLGPCLHGVSNQEATALSSERDLRGSTLLF